jgi:hypothetical protein
MSIARLSLESLLCFLLCSQREKTCDGGESAESSSGMDKTPDGRARMEGARHERIRINEYGCKISRSARRSIVATFWLCRAGGGFYGCD